MVLMVNVIAAILAAFGVLLLLRSLWVRTGLSVRQTAFGFGAAAFVITLIALAATGRLNWIVAAIGALVPFIRRLAGLLRLAPILRAFRPGQSEAHARQRQSGQRDAPPSSAAMTRADALDILGLTASATTDEVVAAHRRLIQRLHPDRGGSNFLAAQINAAKALLLGPRG